MDGGGSCIVSVVFFDRFPNAWPTILFSLEVVMLSLDLECLMVCKGFSSECPEEFERAEGTSLEDLDRDHHDLLCEEPERVDMTEIREGAS